MQPYFYSVSEKTIEGRGGLPFRTDHQDARKCKSKKLADASDIQCLSNMKAAPGLVLSMVRGKGGKDDKENERQPVDYGDRKGGAEQAEFSVVNQEDVQQQVDRGEDDEH